ncbi:MAG: DUF2971 domain-containing protein [Paludibacteraceae bacterium]|nr:DUF2971 domain-containing protein [Paludibacteraceae bacterium]
MSEREQELFICNSLRSKFGEQENYVIKDDVHIWDGTSYSSYDIVIYYHDFPYAVFEIKHHNLTIAPKRFLNEAKNKLNCYWRISTDGATCLYLAGENDTQGTCSFDEMLKRIKDVKAIQPSKAHDALQAIRNIMESHGQPEFVKDLEIIPTASSMPYVCFSSKQTNRKFFESIIGTFNDEKRELHRYMSLDGAFQTVNKLSYRLNGILGMNDKSEGMYWDKIVGESKGSMNNTLNDIFVSSFSKKYDDLTMWRLYGDDGKGVCMSFEINGNYDKNNFILHSVKYAPENDGSLKLFKKLIKNGFIFQDVAEWKCFFKPIEYEIEEEYRLLCRGNLKVKEKDYYITPGSSIINPFVTLDMQAPDFPLNLKSVTLGPKFPRHDGTNIDQLRNLLKARGLPQKIQPSKITTYR